MKFFSNLESGRYKTCGYADPLYDQDGHYDEVACKLRKGFCGEIPCPLDDIDNAEYRGEDR